MKISDFLKTEPNRTDLKIKKKPKAQFPQLGFQKTVLGVWGQFFLHNLIHSSSSSMIGLPVKVFFFMPYLFLHFKFCLTWANN